MKSGNRVLILIQNAPYPQDGRVRLEARALVDAGWEVTVICPSQRGQAWRETLDGVWVRRYPRAKPSQGLLGYVWEYGYSMVFTLVLSLIALVEHGFDVVHACNPPDLFVFLGAIYKLLGKRFVFDHHDLSPEMYYARFHGRGHPLVFRVLAFFEWLSCRVADHVLATNESYKKVEVDRDGVPPERITVVRNGPELERFAEAAPDPELRKKAGTIIGYIGVMGYQDGVDNLLKAIDHLVHDLGRSDVYAVLMGTGDAWYDLKRMVRELGLDEHVAMPGVVTDAAMRSVLATADILAAPEPKNDFTDRSTMIKMMEYMAVGKPIVAFDLTEHRVSGEEAALYAQPNETLDFARQIAALMDDPERRERMGQFGKKRVKAQLAWVHQKHNLLRAYGRLQTANNVGWVERSEPHHN